MELLSGKMTNKGQITLPKKLQELLNMEEGDQLLFIVEENMIKVEAVKKKLLSNHIGRVVVSEAMDFIKMREVVQKEAAETIFREESREYDN